MLRELLGYRCRHEPAVDGAPALQLAGVSVRYPRADRPALDNVALTVQRGQRLALLGSNGAGKSTLLKVAAHMLQPASGSVSVFGIPAGRCYHRVAYLPQRSTVDWTFPINVREFVLTGRYPHLGWLRRPRLKDRESVERSLASVDLLALADRPIDELSGGQQQRMLLARALAQGAQLFLLDEPLTGLDAGSKDALTERFAQLSKEDGITLVEATHDHERLDAYDRVVRLQDGRVVPEPEQAASQAE
ncbi:MAG: metal ABC transporter ATP-binding protein [Planctomycetota bacterium]